MEPSLRLALRRLYQQVARMPVQAQWRGGWWEALLLGRCAGGRLRLQSLPEPDGENELWEALPQQACARPYLYPTHRYTELVGAQWCSNLICCAS